ncbi:hypothetical protein, partial [Delftia sp. ZNC0008]
QGRCGAALQQAHAQLAARSAIEEQLLALDELRLRCPGVWDGLDTRPQAVEHALRLQGSLQAGLTGLGWQEAELAQARQALHQVLALRSAELGEGAAVGMACQQL